VKLLEFFVKRTITKKNRKKRLKTVKPLLLPQPRMEPPMVVVVVVAVVAVVVEVVEDAVVNEKKKQKQK
jgi:uncharacterized membrane protein (DUF106 family)